MTTCNVFKVETFGKGIGTHQATTWEETLGKSWGSTQAPRGRLKMHLFLLVSICTNYAPPGKGGEEPMEIAGVSRDAEA